MRGTKMKKTLTALLALVMLTALVACGGTGGAGGAGPGTSGGNAQALPSAISADIEMGWEDESWMVAHVVLSGLPTKYIWFPFL